MLFDSTLALADIDFDSNWVLLAVQLRLDHIFVQLIERPALQVVRPAMTPKLIREIPTRKMKMILVSKIFLRGQCIL